MDSTAIGDSTIGFEETIEDRKDGWFEVSRLVQEDHGRGVRITHQEILLLKVSTVHRVIACSTDEVFHLRLLGEIYAFKRTTCIARKVASGLALACTLVTAHPHWGLSHVSQEEVTQDLLSPHKVRVNGGGRGVIPNANHHRLTLGV